MLSVSEISLKAFSLVPVRRARRMVGLIGAWSGLEAVRALTFTVRSVGGSVASVDLVVASMVKQTL